MFDCSTTTDTYLVVYRRVVTFPAVLLRCLSAVGAARHDSRPPGCRRHTSAHNSRPGNVVLPHAQEQDEAPAHVTHQIGVVTQ